MVQFLFRNLKGYRFLIGIAIAMTFAQVGADILSALPLKFIFDKVGPPFEDPRIPRLGPLLDWFDRLSTSDGLHKGGGHSQIGVIMCSATLLVVFSLLSAALSYGQLFLAAFVG